MWEVVLAGPLKWAAPWLIDIRALFYRTDVLAAAGVDPATAFSTWESLEATLQRIRDSGSPVAPLAIGNENTFGIIHNVAPFVWSAGGDLIDADGRRSRLAEPPAVDAVQYYRRLVAKYNDPTVATMVANDVPAAFAAGTRLETEPAYGAFREMISHGRMYPSVAAWIIVESIIAKDFADLWHAPGELSRTQIQAILTRASADIDETLADPGHTGIDD